jgi:hypothetical protein
MSKMTPNLSDIDPPVFRRDMVEQGGRARRHRKVNNISNRTNLFTDACASSPLLQARIHHSSISHHSHLRASFCSLLEMPGPNQSRAKSESKRSIDDALGDSPAKRQRHILKVEKMSDDAPSTPTRQTSTRKKAAATPTRTGPAMDLSAPIKHVPLGYVNPQVVELFREVKVSTIILF